MFVSDLVQITNVLTCGRLLQYNTLTAKDISNSSKLIETVAKLLFDNAKVFEDKYPETKE